MVGIVHSSSGHLVWVDLYLASNSTCCTPSMFLISYLCCVPMLSRVSREHFSGLSFCPVLSSNFCSTILTLSACSVFALKKSRASSANNRCEIPGACREIFSSFKVPSWTSFCNNKDRASATKRKRYGDSGSPWRNPRVGWKDSRGIPLRQLEVTNSGDAAHHPSHPSIMKAQSQQHFFQKGPIHQIIRS